MEGQVWKIPYMDVSKNSGTPKSSILIGFSIINHPFWGALIFGNTYIYIYKRFIYNKLIWVRSSFLYWEKQKNMVGLQESWECPFTPPICPDKKRSQKGHFDNRCTFSDLFIKLVGDFNPFQKYARQNGFIFRNFRGENKKYLSCHHLESFISCDEHKFSTKCDPRCSMYGIFTYIWLKFMVNVGKYILHGAFGDDSQLNTSIQKLLHSRSHTKAEGFRLSCAREKPVLINRYEFFTVGGSIIHGPPSLQKSSNAWLQANGGSTVSRWDRQPASWTMKNLPPKDGSVSSPKVSTLAFLLVSFF